MGYYPAEHRDRLKPGTTVVLKKDHKSGLWRKVYSVCDQVVGSSPLYLTKREAQQWYLTHHKKGNP